MNYYQHHIGDFIRDTARLPDSQCMAYLRMIWMYYETESPLENDIDAIAFRIGANASDVQQILKHFFFFHENMWHHARCDKEIIAFRSKSDKAKKSADARWNNANAMRTHSDRNANEPFSDANQEPITNNQEPKEKPKAKKAAKAAPAAPGFALPDWLPKEDWDGFVEMRKRIKAPITPKAAGLIIAELTTIKSAGFDPVASINQSIARAWRGVFPVRISTTTTGSGGSDAVDFFKEEARKSKGDSK